MPKIRIRQSLEAKRRSAEFRALAAENAKQDKYLQIAQDLRANPLVIVITPPYQFSEYTLRTPLRSEDISRAIAERLNEAGKTERIPTTELKPDMPRTTIREFGMSQGFLHLPYFTEAQFTLAVYPSRNAVDTDTAIRRRYSENQIHAALSRAFVLTNAQEPHLRPIDRTPDIRPASAEIANRAAHYRTLENKLLLVISPEDPDLPGSMRQPVSFSEVAIAASNFLNSDPGFSGPRINVSAEEINLGEILIQQYGVRDALVTMMGTTERIPIKLAIYPDQDFAFVDLSASFPEQVQKAIRLAATKHGL